jgi:hypothetical protein
VDEMFLKYDINADSRLENFEVLNLFKDTLRYLGKNREANLVEVRQFIEYADLNRDNKIDKEEMLVVFKKAISNYAHAK